MPSSSTNRSLMLRSSTRRGTPRKLPVSTDSDLTEVKPNGEPQSEDLGDGLGTYRVVGVLGPQGATVITGLPLAPVTATVQQLAVIITVVAVVGLIAAGAAAAFIIGISLRPLRRVASTATQVAGMPLDSGDVALAVRVPDRDTDPHTEVGQVGSAINHMLENVAAALTARHISRNAHPQLCGGCQSRTPDSARLYPWVRGVTRRSETALPPDAANALGRIESESIRMTSLVEDLLLACPPRCWPTDRVPARRPVAARRHMRQRRSCGRPGPPVGPATSRRSSDRDRRWRPTPTRCWQTC